MPRRLRRRGFVDAALPESGKSAFDLTLPELRAARIKAAGIPVTIRRNRGVEIGAACGQLAAERAGAPAAPAVARRRQRLETASARALRGQRSEEPVPAGVDA